MRRKKYFLVYIASKKNETITGNTTATAKYIDFETIRAAEEQIKKAERADSVVIINWKELENGSRSD